MGDVLVCCVRQSFGDLKRQRTSLLRLAAGNVLMGDTIVFIVFQSRSKRSNTNSHSGRSAVTQLGVFIVADVNKVE